MTAINLHVYGTLALQGNGRHFELVRENLTRPTFLKAVWVDTPVLGLHADNPAADAHAVAGGGAHLDPRPGAVPGPGTSAGTGAGAEGAGVGAAVVGGGGGGTGRAAHGWDTFESVVHLRNYKMGMMADMLARHKAVHVDLTALSLDPVPFVMGISAR